MTLTMWSSHQRSASRERHAGLLLLGQPGGVPLVHAVGVGDELVVDADGEADQRDEVGQRAVVGLGGELWRRGRRRRSR